MAGSVCLTSTVKPRALILATAARVSVFVPAICANSLEAWHAGYTACMPYMLFNSTVIVFMVVYPF